MDKKSNRILKLKRRKTIQKPNQYFSEAEKYFIIQELLSARSTKTQIWKKYIGQLAERGHLGYGDF